MCQAVGQQHAEPEPRGNALPPFAERLRPRWAAAAGMALIGTFALAALVAPSSPPDLDVREAAAVPVATKAADVPAGRVVEQGAGLDDGVPTTTGMSKAGLGNCNHGL